MKQLSTFSLLFIIFLSCLPSASAQTKKEIQFSLDTLTKAHQALQKEYNELQEAWREYDAFYEYVKNRLFPKELNNTPLSEAIPTFNAALKMMNQDSDLLKDSLHLISDSLMKTQAQLSATEAKLSTYSDILMTSLSTASFPQTEKDLLGSWDLFLSPVQLSGEPTEAGIIGIHPFNIPDSIKQHQIYKIEFAPDELATITFSNGNSQKCFYSIDDFNPQSNYTIHFSKQDEFKLTIHVSVLPQGLQASYEIPVETDNAIYFQGLMKK